MSEKKLNKLFLAALGGFILIILIFNAPLMIFGQCGISVETGKKADDWDKIFTQDGPGKGLEPAGAAGWTGGDSTYSLLLPGGDTAFFFSDSYIGESPTVKGDGTSFSNANGLRTRVPNCEPPICKQPASSHYAYNSLVIRSKDGKTLTTKTGKKNEQGISTSVFTPDNPAHFYWLGDAAIVEPDKKGAKKIWIFLYEWETNKPGEPFRLDFKGNHIAQMNAETFAVESVNRLENLTGVESHWGTALWFEKDSLFIYGKKTVGGKKKPFVAKINPNIGIARAKDVKNWNFWNGKKWAAGIDNAVSIVPETDSMSDELSVKKVSVNGQTRYLMTTLDTRGDYLYWKDIYLYSSCQPQGPFADKYLVYATPETGTRKLPGMTDEQMLDNKLVIYNPHLHPQFTENGQILISYNSNLPFASSRGDTIYTDVYRPRFIRVKVVGLK